MTVVAVGRDAADGGDGGGGMDFDDHDEADEEMDFDAPMPNSGRDGSGPSMGAGLGSSPGGSGQRKSYGSGAGGGARYRECLKNHAVGLGTHAVDGCGEFMPAGEEGTLDALRCAACGCHRNFHRRDTEGGVAGAGGPSVGAMEVTAFHPQFSPYYPTPAGYLHHHQSYGFGPSPQRPPPLALPSTSGGGWHSREYEGEDASNPMMMGVGSGGGGGGMLGSGSSPGTRKRFRSKFSQEQKDKMLALAERLGWRIQKHDEAAVQQFCEETGVKRHVLKVWMHNNKHTHGKKP